MHRRVHIHIFFNIIRYNKVWTIILYVVQHTAVPGIITSNNMMCRCSIHVHLQVSRASRPLLVVCRLYDSTATSDHSSSSCCETKLDDVDLYLTQTIVFFNNGVLAQAPQPHIVVLLCCWCAGSKQLLLSSVKRVVRCSTCSSKFANLWLGGFLDTECNIRPEAQILNCCIYYCCTSKYAFVQQQYSSSSSFRAIPRPTCHPHQTLLSSILLRKCLELVLDVHLGCGLLSYVLFAFESACVFYFLFSRLTVGIKLLLLGIYTYYRCIFYTRSEREPFVHCPGGCTYACCIPLPVILMEFLFWD